MEFPELTVLAVDDDDLFLKLYENIITKEFKSKFFPQKSPTEALKFLETNTPSLILLDMQMPTMDGFTFLSIIRNDEKLKDIPVIGCSSLTQKDLIIALAELNIEDYIVKTEQKDTYIARIGKAMLKISEKMKSPSF